MIQKNTKMRVVGVDISLEKTSCAIVDIRGNIIATDSFPTIEYPFVGDYVSVLSEHILNLVEANGGYDSIRSVGISAPSGNYRTGCLENAPNMPWKGIVPLAAMVRDRLGMAVALANDAHVMALGERTFGAAHGYRDFIIISIGHGLGSSICCNGQIYLGNNGFAGEIGHSCAIPGGRLCGCGKHGCLEAYTAAKGIIKTAQEVMAESDKPSMMRNTEKLTPRIIASFCDQGDELAIEVFRRTGYWLGIGVANYASIINPDAIIFAGGISKAGHWLLDPTYESFEDHVFHNIQGKVTFIQSTLEEETRDMLGASVLAWEVKEYSLFK